MFRKMSFLVSLWLCFFLWESLVSSQAKGGETMNIEIKSAAFEQGGMIPKQYTCDGKDISPPLVWSGIPAETKSLALICDDPDAPMGTWVHWVIFNIPPQETGLPEGVPGSATLKNGAVHGKNDFRRLGYGGPCPPSGTHRYFFKVYALDKVLDLDPGDSKAGLLRAMEGHIVAQGQLIGRYKR